MRFSSSARSSIEELDSLSTADFVREVTNRTKSGDARVGAILLVGGSDFRSVATRRAQAPMRFDLRSSYWSHAAIIGAWPSDDVKSITGFEVALEPGPGEKHEPGRNGVTAFSLDRYADESRFPNLCIAVATSPPELPGDKGALGANVVAAAKEPNRGRPTYAFYTWLAEWIRYTMQPASAANPIVGATPYPGAAFVDFAYGAAGVNLLPSATAPNTAPEHLWSTLSYWTEALRARIGPLAVYRRVKDKRCPDSE